MSALQPAAAHLLTDSCQSNDCCAVLSALPPTAKRLLQPPPSQLSIKHWLQRTFQRTWHAWHAHSRLAVDPQSCSVLPPLHTCLGHDLSPAFTLPACRFLTHFHADHYKGLTKGFSQGTIVCSPVTAQLISTKIKVCEKEETNKRGMDSRFEYSVRHVPAAAQGSVGVGRLGCETVLECCCTSAYGET